MQKLLPFVNNFHIYFKNKVVSTQTNNIYNLLKENKTSEHDYSNIKKLSFNNSIKIKDIYFKYNDDEGFILKGINLNIKKGQKIGIVGETGSGKVHF